MDEIQRTILLSKISRTDAIKPSSPSRTSADGAESGIRFDDILSDQEVRFSKHAAKRLESRQIELSETDRTKLADAVGALERKGARDSLVLMGELAFIVNVPSKTVVTALSKDQMKEQVFTNIDSTMLVDASAR